MVEEVKKKRSGLRLVSRKSTKKMLGKWRKLDSVDKSDIEVQNNDDESSQHILGLTLNEAIKLNPSLDGLPLPAFFRTALDYVELNGLKMEGIYRVSSPKSRLDDLERKSNKREQLNFLDAHEAAGLIKRFLRQLPEPLLSPDFEQLVEQCKCNWNTTCQCEIIREVRKKLNKLDRSQYHLLGYVFIHAQKVISMEAENKMGIPALGLLLQTVLDISRTLVCYFLINSSDILVERSSEACYLFDGLSIVPYIPPKPSHEVEEWLCGDKTLMEEELRKQNYLLTNLHQQISVLRDADCDASTLEGQVWRVQTAITALKRRLKAATEPTPPASSSFCSNSKPYCEMYEEKQLMAVRCMLSQDIVHEKRRIAHLYWDLIYEKHAKEVGSKDTVEPIEDWANSCRLAEVTRKDLISEISKLRTECAVLRAKIEMHSQGTLSSAQF